MNKGRSTFLVILVIVLLITNIGMLWYFTSDKKSNDGEKMSKNDRQVAFMTRQLTLDSIQRENYIALRVRRDSVLNPLNDSLREAKLKLVSYIKQDQVSDSLVMAAIDGIAARQKPIELEFYRHFTRVRSMCKDAQVAKYDSMLVNMVNRNTGKEDKKDNKKD
jgi:hypothetical protein